MEREESVSDHRPKQNHLNLSVRHFAAKEEGVRRATAMIDQVGFG